MSKVKKGMYFLSELAWTALLLRLFQSVAVWKLFSVTVLDATGLCCCFSFNFLFLMQP